MTVFGLIDTTGIYSICYSDMDIYTLDTVTGRWARQHVPDHMTMAEYARIRQGVPGSLDLDPAYQVDAGPAADQPTEADALAQHSDEVPRGLRQRFTVVK